MSRPAAKMLHSLTFQVGSLNIEGPTSPQALIITKKLSLTTMTSMDGGTQAPEKTAEPPPDAHLHHRQRLTSMMDASQLVKEYDDVDVPSVGTVHVPVVKGDFNALPHSVQSFIAEFVNVCQPKGIYLCDGSEEEAMEVTEKLVDRGMLIKLTAMENCYLCRTDPADVARVESKTFICTDNKNDAVPRSRDGIKCTMGQWMQPDEMRRQMGERLPGSMQGRVMYVIPFSMGPIGGKLSKIGVQLTDFNYVILSMRIMTRVSPKVWEALKADPLGEFVQCMHTIGAPRPLKKKVISHWPDDAEHILIAHFPNQRRIVSYGSGYGGNSLLGKKCFALRIASIIARDEGWLAEHMLIMGVTPPGEGARERFIVAAFPSACGKTNMAMLTPSLPGWTVRCVGDDIAWMRFSDDGRLHAINPEAGFFGVAPGTNNRTNPIAMQTAQTNTIFTNVGMTDDGRVFWEGLEKEIENPETTSITTWTGEQWKIGDPGRAAHPNSRFCTPAGQCPIIHPRWEDPDGVPIDAIVFGGRRPEGVPLVFEALNWEHGVLMGAAVKSEATAAAEHKGREIMHDPMAMRPFFGYNFGHYLRHWLSLNQPGRIMPRIFHVNWFRLDATDKKTFLWPGFGENIRVIDWMCRRVDNEPIAEPSPIGLLPSPGSIHLEGLTQPVDWEQLFSLPKQYWLDDVHETRRFLDEQVGDDLPDAIVQQLNEQEARIKAM